MIIKYILLKKYKIIPNQMAPPFSITQSHIQNLTQKAQNSSKKYRRIQEFKLICIFSSKVDKLLYYKEKKKATLRDFHELDEI